MGLGTHVMQALAREAAFRPFSGVAWVLGRPATGREVALLGFRDVRLIDAAEGAAIDLSQPIGADLEGCADLLVDDSTLGEIFDPTTGLRNVVRLLKPGGRCLLVNRGNASAHDDASPYTMFNPLWFYDYFAVNDFEACEVYVQVHVGQAFLPAVASAQGPHASPVDRPGRQECLPHVGGETVCYQLAHDHAQRKWNAGFITALPSRWPVSVYVFAEKGRSSTWERTPMQHVYRPEPDWAKFCASVKRFRRSARAPLLRSERDVPEPDVGDGWYRIRPDGTLVKTPGRGERAFKTLKNVVKNVLARFGVDRQRKSSAAAK
jgi:hypothetical protein